MIFAVFAAIVLLFGFVLLVGAPYLPTKKGQIETALDLLNLKEGQVLYEFGSGDGRVMRAAAKRGILVTGYELNPILVVISHLTTWKYRKQVNIVMGNFWKADIRQADGIFVFLLDKFMEQLDKKVTNEASKPLVLASFAFRIPSKTPAKTKHGIFLYKY